MMGTAHLAWQLGLQLGRRAKCFGSNKATLGPIQVAIPATPPHVSSLKPGRESTSQAGGRFLSSTAVTTAT
eukprot:2862475-Rhodomonas_salina.1